MTEAVKPTIPQLRFRLPGSWWQIPLTDLEEARASIRRLVDRAVGNRDDHATDRDRMRKQLTAAAEKAVSGSGTTMHIALEIVEGLPVPASFTVFQPELRLSPAVGTGGPAVIAILEQGLQQRADYNPEMAHRFTAHRSEVLRQHRTEMTMTDSEPAEELPGFVVDYWMTVPGAKRVVLVSFSTALAGMDEIMLGFFDSIIGATYWAGMDEPIVQREEASETQPVS